MSAPAAFVFGILIGLIVVGLSYSVYWRRWRGYLMHDMSHFQAKVKSVEATNTGLERQLFTQKTDIAGMRSQIGTLETENRRTQAQIEGVEAEKRALTEHLSTLRVELATYKSILKGPEIVPLPGQHTDPPPQTAAPENGATAVGLKSRSNGMKQPEEDLTDSPGTGFSTTDHTPRSGKPRRKKAAAADNPPVANNSPAAKNLAAPENRPAGKPRLPSRFSLEFPADRLTELSALSQNGLSIPVNGHKNGHKNGSTAGKPAASNGKRIPWVPLDPFIEPEIVIQRPRMGGDRLEIIQGIGPAVLKKLKDEGIDTFCGLAAMTPERLKEMLGPRLARLIDAKSIIDQAKRIMGD